MTDSITKIQNCRLIRDGQIVHDDVLFIQSGKIVNAQNHFYRMGNKPSKIIDAQGLIVASGYIDVQINGAFGVDFSNWEGEEKMKENINIVARKLLRFGCTSFVPTIVSSSPEIYHKVLPLLKPRKGNKKNGSEILGAHVEGPFICEKKSGAHPKEHLVDAPKGFADIASVYGITETENPSIKIITVAPELEGMQNLFKKFIDLGMTVSMGHSCALVEQAERAVESGARFITHLFNAMQQFHHRDPGIIGLLSSTRLPRPYYGLICDGIHVHPNSVKLAYSAHPSGVILVTDAVGAMGLPPGEYKIGAAKIRKIDDYRVEVIENGRLAGSVLTISECVKNFKKFTDCSIVQAIEAATKHPAELLGIEDRKGTLNYGADADLIFLDDDLNVIRCFISGEEVDIGSM